MMKSVTGYGWTLAKRARELARGDIIIMPYGRRHQVLSVMRTTRSVHLRLADLSNYAFGGQSWSQTKRPDTKVGIAHRA